MHCWARYLLIAVVSFLGIGQMIAACGQKGDLYLPGPEKEGPQQTTTGAKKDPTPQIETDKESNDGEGATTDSKVEQPGQK